MRERRRVKVRVEERIEEGVRTTDEGGGG